MGSAVGTPLPFAVRAWMRELDRSTCVNRLGSSTVGRISWQAADGPMSLPVTYAWHNGLIVFRTSPYGVVVGADPSTQGRLLGRRA